MTSNLHFISPGSAVPRSISNASIDMSLPSRWSIGSIRSLRRSKGEACPVLTQAEAVQFLSLPNKIRQRMFTREEQILIRAGCEIALLNAPQEILDELDTKCQSQARHSVVSTPNLVVRSETIAETRPPVPSIPAEYLDTAVDDDSVLDEVEEADEDDIGYFDAHPSALPTALGTPCQTFLRSPTIASEHSLWDSPMAVSVGFPSITAAPSPTRLPMQSGQRASPPPPIRISPPSHYTDPATRAKLREFLSTPEGFDEALQYGFPREAGDSLPPTPMSPNPPVSPCSPTRPAFARRTTRDGVQYRIPATGDEQLDYASDHDSLSSANDDSPVTPHFDPSLRNTGNLVSHETGHTGEPSRQLLKHGNVFRVPNYSDREMTIRMTLTRPELRASDDEIYGWQKDVHKASPASPIASPCGELPDPLALQRLSFSDDMTGQSGAFAKWDGRRRRISLWRAKSSK